ncbi:MAG: hypothetical protein HYT34_00550 [Candidatus Ryanbacteria bacterium]|nr:hypothetical protein [Candidatus Ryanbacteria bacterium]
MSTSSMFALLYKKLFSYLKDLEVETNRAEKLAQMFADSFEITGNARSVAQLKQLVEQAKKDLLRRLESLKVN